MSMSTVPSLVARKLLIATTGSRSCKQLIKYESSPVSCVLMGARIDRRRSVVTFVRPTSIGERWYQTMGKNASSTKGVEAGSPTFDTATNTTTNKRVEEQDRYQKLRIVQTLFSHVWPRVDAGGSLTPKQKQDIRKTKQRATISLGLMIGAKLINIQVPFLFKGLVDRLPLLDNLATTEDLVSATDVLTSTMDLTNNTTTMPPIILAMLLGYGISRATATGMQELRNAIFAHVAQDAIRKVGRSVFDHIHTLDLQFHLERNTGGKVPAINKHSTHQFCFTLPISFWSYIS
jgi:hypothetical protein